MIQFVMHGTQLNETSVFQIERHFTVSKAFSKSENSNRPGMWLDLV